jgi:hypothetical protein
MTSDQAGTANGPAAEPTVVVAAPAAWRGGLTGFLYPLEFAVITIVSMSFTLGVSPHAIFRSLILALVVVTLLILLFTALLRDVHRAAIAAVLAFLLGVSVGTLLMLVVLAGVAIAVLLDRLPRRRIGWPRISYWLSSFTSILLVVILVQAFFAGQLGRAAADLGQGGGLPPASSADPIDPTKPDIYVIILDGYARPDTLQASFGFDDEPFLDQLRSRGFEIASNSHSNYPVTPLTLVTMLDMDYMDKIPEVADLHSGDPASNGQLRHAVNYNKTFELLRGQDYQIVATGSGWEQLAIRQADVYLDGGQLNTFELALLRVSGLARLIQQVAPDWAADQARGRIDATFEELRQVAQTPSSQPRLVIAHVLAPHPPLVYGPNGERLRIDVSNAFGLDQTGSGLSQQVRDAYAGQVAYVNGQVLPVVDALTSSSRRPTVVVLMSDHGARMDTPAGSNVMSPEVDNNFFATLTPGHAGLFGDSPTPVNLFPHLLNAYLGTDLPIHPDRSFISTWDNPLNQSPLPSPTP